MRKEKHYNNSIGQEKVQCTGYYSLVLYTLQEKVDELEYLLKEAERKVEVYYLRSIGRYSIVEEIEEDDQED